VRYAGWALDELTVCRWRVLLVRRRWIAATSWGADRDLRRCGTLRGGDGGPDHRVEADRGRSATVQPSGSNVNHVRLHIRIAVDEDRS
jgi:hypothetical protein